MELLTKKQKINSCYLSLAGHLHQSLSENVFMASLCPAFPF